MGLEDIPDTSLHSILRLLQPRDLASLAMQSRPLKTLVYEPDVWRHHCLSRWPAADVELYGGFWVLLYQSRAEMPGVFAPGSDRIHKLTQAAKEILNYKDGRLEMLFGCIMNDISSFDDLTLSAKTSLKRTAEFRRLQNDMTWWLLEHPDIVVNYARAAAHDGCHQSVQAIKHFSLWGFDTHSSVHPSVQECLSRFMRNCPSNLT